MALFESLLAAPGVLRLTGLQLRWLGLGATVVGLGKVTGGLQQSTWAPNHEQAGKPGHRLASGPLQVNVPCWHAMKLDGMPIAAAQQVMPACGMHAFERPNIPVINAIAEGRRTKTKQQLQFHTLPSIVLEGLPAL